MSYHGRRGPNVSQYLRDLNSINPQDAGPVAEENFNMEDDLALFTNTQFFDFDSGQNTDFQAHPVKVDGEASTNASPPEDGTAASSVMGDMPSLDFIPGEFNFPDFTGAYPAAPMGAFADGAQNFQALQAAHAPVYGNQAAQRQRQQAQQAQQAQYSRHGSTAPDQHRGESLSSGGGSGNFEDASRQAADEDKRRRNTAASARFRIKKKQREQALEKSAKEMSDKMTSLENKVSQLETENKWLKNLLVEKNEGNDEIATLWKEFTKQASGRMEQKKGSAATSKQ